MDFPRSLSGRAAPLTLLLRVNTLQAWRRLMAIREQSRLLSFVIALFVNGARERPNSVAEQVRPLLLRRAAS